MKADARALDLHDKATRGKELSCEERTYLEQWYASQDQEERAMLLATSPPPSLTELRERVNASLSRIPIVTQRLQALAAANDALRQEAAQYKEKLAKAPTTAAS